MRQKYFDGKSRYPLRPPTPFIHKLFRYRKFSETQHRKVLLHKFFSTVRQKHSDRKSWYPPLMHKFFRYPKFFETQKDSPAKFFCTVRQQIFDRKSWYSPLMRKIFRYLKLSKTQKGSSTKCFGTVRQNNSGEKSWYPSHSLIPNIFSIPDFFWNTERFLYEFFRYCETKNFQRKIVILFCIKYTNEWWNCVL